MKDTPPPCFPKENKEELEVKAHIRSIVEKALADFDKLPKVPKEGYTTQVLGGKHGFCGYDFIFYQPHEFRLYFHFSKDNFSVITLGQKLGCKPINNGSELFVDDFEGCSLRIKKNTVEIVNKILSHRWFRINLGNEGLISQQVEDIIRLKASEAVDVFKHFVSQVGGSSDFVAYKVRCENKWLGDELSSQIPLNWTFQNGIVKKVYKEHSIELPNVEHAMNYATNIALRNFCPEIAFVLERIERSNLLNFLKSNVHSISDVTGKFMDDIMRLSPSEKEDFSNWLFSALLSG